MKYHPLATIRLVWSAVRLVRDPSRLEEIFKIADTVESPEVARELETEFRKTPEYAKALAERPRVGSIDVGELLKLPEGTLGRTYAEFMRQNNLDPEDIEINKVNSDFDYIRAHFRETHDLWHVVTGFRTDVASELGLQAFSLAHFNAPLSVMLLGLGMINMMLFEMNDREARMAAIARGWILGKRSRPLFGYRWRENFHRPLVDVQRELGIDAALVDRTVEALSTRDPMVEPIARAA
jgi:ubiquinone biosynthesis protein Coq4